MARKPKKPNLTGILENWDNVSEKKKGVALDYIRDQLGLRADAPVSINFTTGKTPQIVLPRNPLKFMKGVLFSPIILMNPTPFSNFTVTDKDWRDKDLPGNTAGKTLIYHRIDISIEQDEETGLFKVNLQYDLQFRILLDKTRIEQARQELKDMIDRAVETEVDLNEVLGTPLTPAQIAAFRRQKEIEHKYDLYTCAGFYAHERAHVKSVQEVLAEVLASGEAEGEDKGPLRELLDKAAAICEQTAEAAQEKANDCRRQLENFLKSLKLAGLGHDYDDETTRPPMGEPIPSEPNNPMPPDEVADDKWQEDQTKLNGYSPDH